MPTSSNNNPIKDQLDRAQALDLRRQQQIENQRQAINRLLALLGAAENYIRELGKGDAWAQQRQAIEATYSQETSTQAQGDSA